MAPSSGPGGAFSSATAITDGDGIAQAPPFVASALPGSFSVQVQAGGAVLQTNWTNVPVSSITPLPAVAGNRFRPNPYSTEAGFVQAD